MPRDYNHENMLSKARERRYQVKLKHDEAEMLNACLKSQGITFTEWVRRHINHHPFTDHPNPDHILS